MTTATAVIEIPRRILRVDGQVDLLAQIVLARLEAHLGECPFTEAPQSDLVQHDFPMHLSGLAELWADLKRRQARLQKELPGQDNGVCLRATAEADAVWTIIRNGICGHYGLSLGHIVYAWRDWKCGWRT